MKNEFVPYDIALAMKELGYPQYNCIAYFSESGEFIDVGHPRINATMKAPLYQQAFRWFREEFGIDVCIIPKFGDNGYGAECFKNGSLLPIELLGNEYTYEEAQAECLRQITDFVKQ